MAKLALLAEASINTVPYRVRLGPPNPSLRLRLEELVGFKKSVPISSEDVSAPTTVLEES